ncbi:MAG: Crp/Fnr family transcriptional regulator [Wenzhouxiangellaceae bacterium]|nr:Crp/Fnr family transcriptional regulator [Wenzhouxiangellaceae bacterium]
MNESRETISFAEVDRHPVLSQLPAALKQRAAERARVVRLGRAEPLFQQGDPARWVYLCRSGQLKLFRLSDNGDEKIVNLINAGRSFAEATMFMSERRYPVYCSSLKVSELVAFDAEDLVSTFKTSPELCFQMLGMLSRRLHEKIGQIEALSLQNAQTRIANYLLEELRKMGSASRFELPIGKKYVANFLSVKAETFSRVVAGFEQAGVLTTHARNFTVIDVPALERIASGASPAASC